MSEIETCLGKIVLLKKLENESLEQQKKRILKEHKIKFNDNDVDDIFQDKFYRILYIKDNDIYSIKDYKIYFDLCDLFQLKKNKDGEFEFFLQFYNGGCGFDEALDEAFKRLKNDKKMG